ncbi:MAG: hypothetical protein JWP87_970 [Labilithrix sp.]|nr:hypothetical protein [Labilithrix sp.]
MTPRTSAYGDAERGDLDAERGDLDAEGEDLPVRDRPYESFGKQGVARPTYGDEAHMHRGAERVDLGEPIAEADARNLPPGPKGWARRDDRIHEDVCARLTEDGDVDASDLEVIVHHGEVTLSGTVTARAQRERAIRIAESVRGVIDVLARIRVGTPSSR